MRELEFLPAWYREAHRRRRIFVYQTFATLVLVCGAIVWTHMSGRNISSAQAAMTTYQAQLQQRKGELKQLDEQLRLKNELAQQQKINEAMGVTVEMTRILATLASVMPREMTILDMSIDTEETVRQIKTPTDARAALKAGTQKPTPVVDRRLKVRLLAVTPNDVDLANFLTGLSTIKSFEGTFMSFAKDRAEDGRIMREFQVTFYVNLNQHGGG
jgi:hypothetical protein